MDIPTFVDMVVLLLLAIIVMVTTNNGKTTRNYQTIDQHLTDLLLERKSTESLIADARRNLKIASWTKRIDGTILGVNDRALNAIFLPLGISNPIGMKFEEIFGKAVGDKLKELDDSAISEVDASQIMLIQLDPLLDPMLVIKTAVYDEDGNSILQGMAFRLKDSKNGIKLDLEKPYEKPLLKG